MAKRKKGKLAPRPAAVVRASSSGDLERRAESALRELAVPATDPGALAADARALETSQALRAQGRADLALRVATAAAGRALHWRMEEALAALAAGDDARARTVAATDPVVDALVAPLLSALEGTAPRAPTKLPPLAADLFVAAKVSAALVGGEGHLAPKLSRTLRASTAPWARRAVAASEIFNPPVGETTALRLLDDDARHAPAVREAAVRVIAQRRPSEWVDQLHYRTLVGPALWLQGVGQALLALGAWPPEPGRVAAIAGIVGASAFPPSERRTALLYEGFALMPSDSARGRGTLDRAIAEGADLLEVLRAKLLEPVDLGADGPSTKQADRRAHDALRLAKALWREKDLRAVACVAAREACDSFCMARKGPQAREALALARSYATDSGLLDGQLATELELSEAMAWVHDDRARAQRLLEAILAREPRSSAAWEALVLSSIGTPAHDDIVRRAAAATGDRRYQELARALGPVIPTAPLVLVPSKTSAGALGLELLRRVLDGHSASDDLTAAAAALPAPARAAYEAAELAVLAVRGREGAALERLRARFSAPDLSAASLLDQLVVLTEAMLDWTDVLDAIDWTSSVAPALGSGLFDLAVAEDELELASDVLARIAYRLSSRELKAKRRALKGRGVPSSAIDAVIARLTEALAPELPLEWLLDEARGDDPALQNVLAAAEGTPQFDDFLELLGLPRTLSASLDPERLTAIGPRVAALMEGRTRRDPEQVLAELVGLVLGCLRPGAVVPPRRKR